MPHRVLIVEDDETLRWVMSEGVKLLGLDVAECSTADEALILLGRPPSVDLIITDIQMPGSINGLGLARLVWSRWPSMPVVITSGHANLPQSTLPPNSRFLPKPCALEVLHAAVVALLPLGAGAKS